MTFEEAFNPIRALKSTFETMNLQPAHLWGGGILLLFVEQIPGIGFQFVQPVGNSLGEGAMGFLFCGTCVAGLGFFLLATWLMSGLFLNLRSVLQTGEPTEGGIFDHQDKFLPLLLTRLLVLICVLILLIPGLIMMGFFIFACAALVGQFDSPVLAIVVMIFGFIVSYAVMIFCASGIMLAESIVIFEDLTPMEAVKRSWSLVGVDRWMFFKFIVVNVIFAMLGLLCCIGFIATGAIARLATAEAYLQFTSGDELSPAEA